MKPTKGYKQLVEEAEALIDTLSTEEVSERIKRAGTLLVDLRDVREVKREGKIDEAFHVPRGMLEFWIDPDSPYYQSRFDDAEEVILYCNKGWRSALAAKSLVDMGFTNVAHMDGGMERWTEQERPVTEPG